MKEYWLVWKTLQTIARILSTVFFDLKVEGLEYIPASGGAMIVCNHQSYLDPILMNVRLRRPLSYMAKAELFENAFMNWLLWSVGAFPVHQGTSDIAAVRKSIRRLREGWLLNIFPEGARTQTGEIGTIEKGMALIDRRAHVPVIPAVIVGAFEAWPWNRRFPKPGPVRIRFGPPMKLADLNSAEIVTRVDQTLREMFNEMRGKR
ncbi:MAG TPA: lysophospholipid acyltransferase family protein [Tepidisphaeraceae bacterium]|nr:lysophospholipid acyltransferase family protein [Tepidisphaeraceae bacterium]